jgi:chromosome segregation ATPase
VLLRCAAQAAKDRATLLEAQNNRLNQELSAAESAHNRLTQQLAAADLQNAKLTQQLSTTEAAQSRSHQQLATADAANAKLLQQLSGAEGEVSALRSELGMLQGARQQAEVACEQLRQLQQDQQRHLGQLRTELAEASQEIMVRMCAAAAAAEHVLVSTVQVKQEASL